MFDYLIETHNSTDWFEWGSAARGPLVQFDGAHAGEWLTSIIGAEPTDLERQRIYHIVRCELCILTHVWPLPSQEELDAYYEGAFYRSAGAHEHAQHVRDKQWWEEAVYAPLLGTCVSLLKQQGCDWPFWLCDVGAGYGLALDTAQGWGWITSGVEPDVGCVNRLQRRGHDMYWGTLQQAMRKKTNGSRSTDRWKPDVWLLWETLEHQRNPEEYLLDLYDAMRPRSLLVLSVPNDFSPLQLAARDKYKLPYYWLTPPVHLHYFTPKTLQLVVRRAGFKILDMRGTYPLEQHMLDEDGACYVGNTALWQQYTDIKIAREIEAVHTNKWEELVAEYRENLATRIGRSIVCIAQRA